jgi:predicted transcriptional regulator
MGNITIDEFLKVLANDKRREILRLLSYGDRYAYELAKMINITPRAVTKHLESLQEGGFVFSDKRPSDKGPDRDYFSLNKGLVFKVSIAQNLFYENISNLQEDEFYRVIPSLQLSAPQSNKNLAEIIKEGLNFLPDIKSELEILEIQHTRLLRKYQGMLMHMRELLKKQGFTSPEIEFIITLTELNGKASQRRVLEALSMTDVTLEAIVNSLIDKEVITYQVLLEEGRAPTIMYELNEKYLTEKSD